MNNDNRLENVKQLVQMAKPQFEELAKIHGVVNFKEEASFALQLLQENDFLCRTAMANQDSFKRAILNVAIVGLSLNPYKREAYLIPRKGKVCMDISYQGYVNLFLKAGAIKFATAEIVYENDFFKYNGAHAEPDFDADIFSNRGRIVGGFVKAQSPSGDWIITHMPIDQVYAVRDRSESWKAYKSKGTSCPWITDELEMIKKTLIRNGRKSWPTFNSKTIEIAERVVEEAEPIRLNPAPDLDDIERSDLLLNIRTALDILEKTEASYLKYSARITGHKDLKALEDLTKQELKQASIGLSQLVDQKNAKDTK